MLLIAEIGQNHNGDMGMAVELIQAAKEQGADVAKFQVYDARALFPPREENEWFDYNCKTELSRNQVESLAEACSAAGIEFMASVFDPERVGWLEALGVPRYKVASRSIRDQPLLEALGATRKPLIASLGMWGEAAFPTLPTEAPVEFLYCIAKYPTPLEDLHLGQVDFVRHAGFSDHTIGTTAAMTAMALGARIVEKHFTLDRSLEGPDHSGSMTPQELGELHRFRLELPRCLGT